MENNTGNKRADSEYLHTLDDIYRTGDIFDEDSLVGEFCLTKRVLLRRLNAPRKPTSISIEDIHDNFPELDSIEPKEPLCLPKKEWVERLRNTGLRYEESLYALFADIVLSGQTLEKYYANLEEYLKQLESGEKGFRLG